MMWRWSRRSGLCLGVAALLLVGLTALADLRNYAPTSVTVTTSSGTLLDVDNRLHTVQLTNTGSFAVWYCHGSQTAEVGKGFYLGVECTITFSGDAVPHQGLKAIADGGSTTVAVGRG